MSDSRPLIVTAGLAAPDKRWATRLRTLHFPPERNWLDAHLTLFHALPPSLEDEVRARMARIAAGPPPRAMVTGLMSLGRGVAIAVESAELAEIRRDLQSAFHGSLSAQDAGGWRPHVTVQNKVEPMVARETLETLEREGEGARRPLGIVGLELYRYDGGPWAKVRDFPFRGA